MSLPTVLAALILGVPPAPLRPEAPPPEQPASSRVVAATVYPELALVTREVAVPEGLGTIELLVAPLPGSIVDSSIAAEGSEGVRVLGAKCRVRTVSTGIDAEIRQREATVRQLGLDLQTLQAETAVQLEDQRLLRELGDLSTRTTRNLAEAGRFEDTGAVNLARFLMTTRAERSRAETELRQRTQGVTEAGEVARRELSELQGRATQTVREALITLRKDRPDAATIRLQYLVLNVSWAPQYRIRAATDEGPVRFEALAALRQSSGEPWVGVALTLATAQPNTDAAPPELTTLRMTLTNPPPSANQPVDTHDERSERVRAVLDRPIPLRFPQDTPLSDVIKYLSQATQGTGFPNGVPLFLDRVALVAVDKTEATPVSIDLADVPLRTSLRLLLNQIDLTYVVQDGVLTITKLPDPADNGPTGIAMMGGMGGGMGGMGGGMPGTVWTGVGALEQAQAAEAVQNRAAALNQGKELRIEEKDLERDLPEAPGSDLAESNVTLRVVGPVDAPTRPDPLLIEVSRAELPASYFAQATPVLSTRVYRVARLTNTSPLVILPGNATVYRGDEFVGRMDLPLVAAGESFEVGLGVDPQLQVSRRLTAKTRTVQGGNQILAYAFRLNIRNYRDRPVLVRLQDRLPMSEGETGAVRLGRTSRDLNADAIYRRTGLMDNLLRWDLDVPAQTVGDHPLSVEYDFRIEYAKDLPAPRFLLGGLKEEPIGGPARLHGAGGFRNSGFESVPPQGAERSGPIPTRADSRSLPQ